MFDRIRNWTPKHPSGTPQTVPVVQADGTVLYEGKSAFGLASGDAGMVFGQPARFKNDGTLGPSVITPGNLAQSTDVIIVGVLPGNNYRWAVTGIFINRDLTTYALVAHNLDPLNYYETPGTAGAPVRSADKTATDARQLLYLVIDANTIAVNVQQAVEPVTAPTSNVSRNASTSMPDPNQFDFWIQSNTGAFRYSYNNAWV